MPPFLAGVLGRAWLCARSACTPPFLARVCGLAVCAWARGWAAPPFLAGLLGCLCVGVAAPFLPCHSWLGCAMWMCVLGLGLRLRPAIPVWGVGVCACLFARSACTPPLLVRLCVLVVYAWARVPVAARHSWLMFWGVYVFLCAPRFCPATQPVPRHSWLWCPAWVRVFGLGLRLRPAIPVWGVGGCVCVCSRAPLYPATPGWAVRFGCVCLGSSFGCIPPLLANVLGCVCVCVRAPLLPCLSACSPPLLAVLCGLGACVRAPVSAALCHSSLGCWGVCVFVCALCFHSPLLAGVLGCVCACVHAPLVPRHSWLGFAVWVCVFGLGFRLPPATPSWGFLGVCGFVCALRLVPCDAWLERAVRVCVLGLGSRLRPATPGCRFGVCVCLYARSACIPPLLAGLCIVGVCAWARVSAAPRHTWLGFWVCVCLCAHSACAPPLSAGVCGVGVCLGSGFGCAPPLLAGSLGCLCACVHAPLVARHSWLGLPVSVRVFGLMFRLRPATPSWGFGVYVGLCSHSAWSRATPGWGMRCGCVCFSSGLVCAPPLLAAVWVCALWVGSGLRPATPCWGVGVSVCLCARSACTPPILVGVCVVGVGAWARVSAAPRHSWLWRWGVYVFVCRLCLYPATPDWGLWCGCVSLGSHFGCAAPLVAGALGCKCVCVRAPLVPRHSWLGCMVWVCVFGLGFRLRPATPGSPVGVWVSVFGPGL